MSETSQNLLQRAVEITPALMFQARLDGAVVEANQAWNDLLGWSEAELRGKNYLELVHADDLDTTRDQVERGKATAVPFAFENRYRHKDGTYRWVAWTAIVDGDHLHASGRDITAQKDATDALNRAQQALRHLQKVDSTAQLSGGIAHDFNNSLQSIVASLELVRRLISANRMDETERFIASAVSAARNASTLNQKMHGLSRRQPIDEKVLDLNALIVGTEDLLRRALPRAINLDLKLATDAWKTRCDANQVEAALLNLVLNARDAMSDNGTMTIETRNVDVEATGATAPGQYVGVVVTDSGAGMAPDVAARAADAFFTTKTPGINLGLGLTMVDEFARRSGGGIEIDSATGRGTSVTLYLPRHSPEESA